MAPGLKFKRSVKEISTGLDKAENCINKLNQADNHFKSKIFSDPNTKVDIIVKTRHPKRPSDDWSSILSDNTGKGCHKNLIHIQLAQLILGRFAFYAMI